MKKLPSSFANEQAKRVYDRVFKQVKKGKARVIAGPLLEVQKPPKG